MLLLWEHHLTATEGWGMVSGAAPCLGALGPSVDHSCGFSGCNSLAPDRCPGLALQFCRYFCMQNACDKSFLLQLGRIGHLQSKALSPILHRKKCYNKIAKAGLGKGQSRGSW